jgi:hypothetical protein
MGDRMKLFRLLGIIGLLCGLVSVSLGTSCNNLDENVYVAAAMNSTPNSIVASYQYFDGKETREIKVEANQNLVFTYSSKAVTGTLSIRVLDGDGNLSTDFEIGVSKVHSIGINKTGTYKLVIKGVATRGNYDVSWETK